MNAIAEIRVYIDGEEMWFHREMELPFAPVEGTYFEFELVGPPKNMIRRHASFVVQAVTWVERDGKIHFWLEVDDDEEEEFTITCFNPLTWKEGEYEAWRW